VTEYRERSVGREAEAKTWCFSLLAHSTVSKAAGRRTSSVLHQLQYATLLTTTWDEMSGESEGMALAATTQPTPWKNKSWRNCSFPIVSQLTNSKGRQLTYVSQQHVHVLCPCGVS